MIKLTILLLFSSGYESLVIKEFDTVGECRLSQEYYQNEVKHGKVVFACLKKTNEE